MECDLINFYGKPVKLCMSSCSNSLDHQTESDSGSGPLKGLAKLITL